MKAIGKHLFHMSRTGTRQAPVDAWQRIDARTAGLNEAWFRDAIFDNPELVLSPCRAAGQVDQGEAWLPWCTGYNFGSGPADVLLVSSCGRIGIVETRLSGNAQERREAVAQVLDYALSLQGGDFSSLDLPPLPEDEAAPDIDDLRDGIEGGKFLLILAGDALDPGALRLSQAVLGRSMTSEWDLAMVDLNVFESRADPDGVLIVPELLGTVQAEVRNVVPRIESREEFLEMVNESSREVVSRILERFQQVTDSSDGSIHWGFRAATANLYWNTPTGGSRRILTIKRDAAFRVWLGYLVKQGYTREAELVREQVQDVVQIEPGDQSGRVLPDAGNIDVVLRLIDGIAKGLASQGDQ